MRHHEKLSRESIEGEAYLPDICDKMSIQFRYVQPMVGQLKHLIIGGGELK